MKKLLLATAIAAATLLSAVQASAQGIYFEFGDSPRYYDDSPRLYRAPPRYYRDRYEGSRYERQRCWKEPYQVRSHNHEITKYRTVCRD
ncbi:hypothetical protein ASC90_00570 [Rhizobium sp. Root1220]|nr:hypothetical protein [Rhizobium sp. Root1220]KQV84054.1 hypothetical protein ASC90_00570 [Rhizobium sp. Root1220]